MSVLGAVVLIASATAVGADRPVISGDPIVGHVLTSSPGPTGQALYKWQSCDPATADCSDSLEHNDPNWTDLTTESHTGQSYTVAATDLGHFIRVLIHDNNLGDQWATSVPVGPVGAGKGPPPTPPAPQHGISVLGDPEGSVRVRPPGQGGFSPINGLTLIPINSVIDTRGGKLHLTAAVGDLGNTTPDQSVDFYGGIFRIKQSPAVNSLAIAKLAQKLSCGGPKGKSARASGGGPLASSSRRRSRRVWGSGHGGYATAGGGGTGSVRGTSWLTVDSCKGTFFRVTEGLGITVKDNDLNKLIELGPGQSYFAQNR